MNASLHRAVVDVTPAVRQLSDVDLHAFAVACVAELARREGAAPAAAWARDQAARLREGTGEVRASVRAGP